MGSDLTWSCGGCGGSYTRTCPCGTRRLQEEAARDERGQIVARLRERVRLLQSHGQEMPANAMENLADELEAENG